MINKEFEICIISIKTTINTFTYIKRVETLHEN